MSARLRRERPGFFEPSQGIGIFPGFRRQSRGIRLIYAGAPTCYLYRITMHVLIIGQADDVPLMLDAAGALSGLAKVWEVSKESGEDCTGRCAGARRG